ncbi:DUF2690 domain-containing protein [Streptomyces sp. LZ34]
MGVGLGRLGDGTGPEGAQGPEDGGRGRDGGRAGGGGGGASRGRGAPPGQPGPAGYGAPPAGRSPAPRWRCGACSPCADRSCQGRDPYREACDRDSVTVHAPSTEGRILRLRYSPVCRAVWAEVDPAGSTEQLLAAAGGPRRGPCPGARPAPRWWQPTSTGHGPVRPTGRRLIGCR